MLKWCIFVCFLCVFSSSVVLCKQRRSGLYQLGCGCVRGGEVPICVHSMDLSSFVFFMVRFSSAPLENNKQTHNTSKEGRFSERPGRFSQLVLLVEFLGDRSMRSVYLLACFEWETSCLGTGLSILQKVDTYLSETAIRKCGRCKENKRNMQAVVSRCNMASTGLDVLWLPLAQTWHWTPQRSLSSLRLPPLSSTVFWLCGHTLIPRLHFTHSPPATTPKPPPGARPLWHHHLSWVSGWVLLLEMYWEKPHPHWWTQLMSVYQDLRLFFVIIICIYYLL